MIFSVYVHYSLRVHSSPHTYSSFYVGILHSIRFDLRHHKTNRIEGLQTFMILLSHTATICEYFYFLYTKIRNIYLIDVLDNFSGVSDFYE